MWKPQVTPLAEVRSTPEGPMVTKTSLTTNKQEFRSVSSKYNAKPAPFQQIGNKKMVNPAYNTPLGIYSDDAIAETLSAQAEVLGQGVIGVNFMKNEKTYDGNKSDVLKMVQEMDISPARAPSPGIVVICGSPSIGISHESPVQGQSFKLLERSLGTESPHPHSPVPAGTCSIIKPGENICSVCGSLIIGVFVRIKNKNLHEHCFKCATCGISLKNKGYYHVNDRPYCEVHATSAARQNPPGPNLEPITVGPGSPLPSGAFTTSQAKACASKFSPQSPVSPKIHGPSNSASGPELLLKEVDQLSPMPTASQIMQEAPFNPVSNIQLMEQMLPKSAEPSIGQLESYIERKSCEAVESSVKISTETRTISEGSMATGSNVSMSGGESKHSTNINLDLAKDHQNEVPSNTMEERHIETQISDEQNIRDIQRTNSPLINQRKEIPSPHLPEVVPPFEVKQNFDAQICVADKRDETKCITQQENIKSESMYKEVDQNINTETNVPINKVQLPISFNEAQKNTNISSTANTITGLPDLSTMDLGSHKSSSFEYAKKESKMSSSSTQQYTASSSCYQSFGLEQKSESSNSAVKMTDNIAIPVSSVFNVPSPVSPAATTKHISAPTYRSDGISNQQMFGASSGDINVRTHIPKKGPAPPSSFLPEAPKPISMISSPLLDLPKPSMPPGLGAPQRGIAQMPGQRTAPKRGKGIINPASVSRVPMCATCQRQIRGPFVSALGKTWCPDCFICATSNCRRQLINLGFVEEKGGLHCEDCYERYLAPSCGKCDKKIKGDCLNAISKHFHPECFCCAYCGKIFGSGAFYLEDGLPYCEADWNDLFTTKCVGCKFPIEAGDRWVEALNNNYHSQCFKCSVCKSNLEGKSFYAKNGRPFCKAHASR